MMMYAFDFDMSNAPKGKTVTRYVTTKDGQKPFEAFEEDHVILATKCGKVTRSYWIPNEQRWCMLSKNEDPVAWMPWPVWPEKELARAKSFDEVMGDWWQRAEQ